MSATGYAPRMRVRVAIAVVIAVALCAPTAALGAGSACDEGQVLLPRTTGVDAVTLPTGPAAATWQSGGPNVNAAIWSPDGTRIYASAGALREIDAATGTTLRTVAISSESLAVAPDGKTIYAATSSGVSFIDVATFTVTATVVLDDGFHIETPNRLAVSPDGSRLYVKANWGGTSWGLFAIDTATRHVATHVTSGTSPSGIVVTSDGLRVLTTRTNFSARLDIWNATTLASQGQVNIDLPSAGIDNLGGIAAGQDPSIVFVVDTSAADVAVVDIAAAQILRRLSGYQAVSQVAVNWAGTKLVVSGADGSYSQAAWDVADPVTGSIIGSGVTTGPGGMGNGTTPISLCPRHVADPAPSPTSSGSSATASTPAAATATATVRPRGTAALRAPTGCVAPGTVVARVTVRNARSVAFYRNGIRVRTAAAGTGRHALALTTRIRADDFTRYRLVVRVRYPADVTPGVALLSRRFGQCRASAVTG